MGKYDFPTDDQLVALVEEHGTLVAVGKHLGIPDGTLHSHIRRSSPGLAGRIQAARELSDVRVPRPTQVPLPDKDELAAMLRRAPSLASVAETLGVNDSTLRGRCKRLGIDYRAGGGKETLIDGDRAELTASELKTAEELMAERGLDEATWRVTRCTVNEWGLNPETGEPYKQLKVHLERKPDLDWIFPAVHSEPVRPKPRKPAKGKPQTWVLVSDHQAPLEHKGAHQSFLRFMEAVKPDCGVHLGDLIDLGNVSRFGDSGDPKFNAPVQTCINEGYRILREIVDASPKTDWHLLLGNHDERIRKELLTRAERLHGIRPADIPGAEREDDALSLRRLLRLNDLRINLIDEPAGYKHNSLRIGNDFEIRHGMFTGPNPSKKTMDTLQASVAVGHTHAKSLTFKSLFNRDGVSTILQGAEIGSMCQNNLGYNNAPGRTDWHLGWAVVTLFPSDHTNLEHVVYHESKNQTDEGVAVWRGQQY